MNNKRRTFSRSTETAACEQSVPTITFCARQTNLRMASVASQKLLNTHNLSSYIIGRHL